MPPPQQSYRPLIRPLPHHCSSFLYPGCWCSSFLPCCCDLLHHAYLLAPKEKMNKYRMHTNRRSIQHIAPQEEGLYFYWSRNSEIADPSFLACSMMAVKQSRLFRIPLNSITFPSESSIRPPVPLPQMLSFSCVEKVRVRGSSEKWMNIGCKRL